MPPHPLSPRKLARLTPIVAVAFLLAIPVHLASASPAGPAVVGVAPDPSALLYDPGNHDLYVANAGNDTVSVLDGRTNALLATVPVGSGPDGLAYDPVTHTVWVANGGSNNLTLIDSHWSVAGNLSVGSQPRGIAYDPANGAMYVANTASGNVSVLSTNISAGTGTITVGSDPWAIAYDPTDRELFVTNSASGSVSVISSVSNTVVATVATGSFASGGPSFDPAGVAFDPATRQMVVTNPDLGYVVVLSSSRVQVVGHTNITGKPWAIAYDPFRSGMIVTQYANGSFVLLSGSLASVEATYATGAQPVAVAVNPGNQRVAIASLVLNSPIFFVFYGYTALTLGGPNTTALIYPGFPAYDPLTSEWFVPNDPGFNLHPASANGTVAVVTSGSSGAIVSTVTTWGVSPQQVVFDSYSDDLYVANLYSGLVSVIDGTTGTFLGNISTPLTEGLAILDDPDNHDVYLSGVTGTAGIANVSVLSAKTNTFLGNIGVGDYPAGLAYSPATHDIYCVNYGDGNVSVIRGSTNTVVANINVGYSPLYVAYDPANHDIYVANAGNLTVIDSTNAVVAWITIPGSILLWYLAYDAANSLMVVADIQTAKLYWLSSTNALVASTATDQLPTGLGYDPGTQQFIVCNYEENSVSFLVT